MCNGSILHNLGLGNPIQMLFLHFPKPSSIQYGHRTPYWILEYWFSCHLDNDMLQHYAEKQKLSRIYWHCTVWTACSKTLFKNIKFHSPLMHNLNRFYILSTFQNNRQSKKGYIHESIGSCVTLSGGIKIGKIQQTCKSWLNMYVFKIFIFCQRNRQISDPPDISSDKHDD